MLLFKEVTKENCLQGYLHNRQKGNVQNCMILQTIKSFFCGFGGGGWMEWLFPSIG